MKSDTCSEKLSKVQICLTAAVFLICLAGAYLIKIEYTPDEYARKLLSDWIFENGRLPLGNEQEIIIPGIIRKTGIAQYERGVTLSGKVEPFETLGDICKPVLAAM